MEFGGEVEDGEGEGLMQVLVGQSCEREREREVEISGSAEEVGKKKGGKKGDRDKLGTNLAG